MTTKLTRANEKYLELLEEVESAQAVVTATETSLSVQRQILAEKRKKVAEFEEKHVGETLLKPYKVPAKSSYTITMNTSHPSPFIYNG